jgi:hypothetical protein
VPGGLVSIVTHTADDLTCDLPLRAFARALSSVNADTRENIDWRNWPLGLINDIKTSRKKLTHRMWTVFGGRIRLLA